MKYKLKVKEFKAFKYTNYEDLMGFLRTIEEIKIREVWQCISEGGHIFLEIYYSIIGKNGYEGYETTLECECDKVGEYFFYNQATDELVVMDENKFLSLYEVVEEKEPVLTEEECCIMYKYSSNLNEFMSKGVTWTDFLNNLEKLHEKINRMDKIIIT